MALVRDKLREQLSSQGIEAERHDFGGNSNVALRAGDSFENIQYRFIVSFGTSDLPDGATIDSATLKLTRGSVNNANPFDGTTGFGKCIVDIKNGSFGDAAAVEDTDFEAAPTAPKVAIMSSPVIDGAKSIGSLNAAGLVAINKMGKTQLRVSFEISDNDNKIGDFIGFYSGSATESSNRPILEVTYH